MSYSRLVAFLLQFALSNIIGREDVSCCGDIVISQEKGRCEMTEFFQPAFDHIHLHSLDPNAAAQF